MAKIAASGLMVFFSTILGFILIFSSLQLFASPASSGMLDADGCHVCKLHCEKYGLKKGQKHCHVLVPAMYSEYIYDGQSSLASVYGRNVINGLDDINLTEDKTEIILLPGKQDISGTYKALSQSCNYGGGPFQISKGAPKGFTKFYNAKYDPGMDGIYSWNVGGKDYLAIFTKSQRLLVYDQSNNIKCAGDLIRGTFSMACDTSFASGMTQKTGSFCRTALIPAN